MRYSTYTNSRLSGFTVVELVVVISIVGILAALTLAAYRGIQDDARIATGLAFASQLEDKHMATVAGMWKFEECSGTTVKSEGAQPVTTTPTGTVTFSTDTPSGTGCSLVLNGSTRLNTTAKLSTNPTAVSEPDYYIKSAWIKLQTCARNNNIISDPTSGGGAPFYLPTTSSTKCRINAGHDNNFSMIVSKDGISPGKWTHVAVEFDAGTFRMYINGKLDNETTGRPDKISTVPNGANIGAHGSGNTFIGLIDDVMIVNQRPR